MKKIVIATIAIIILLLGVIGIINAQDEPKWCPVEKPHQECGFVWKMGKGEFILCK